MAVENKLCLDFSTCHNEKPEVLTDGFVPSDGTSMHMAHYKAEREKDFPIEVIHKGLEMQLEKANASRDSDRTHILNAIAGRAGDDLDLEPYNSHPKYTCINQQLRGLCAHLVWPQALREGKVEFLNLPALLHQDEHRSEVNVSFAFNREMTNSDCQRFVESLPMNLATFELNLQACTGISDAGCIAIADQLPSTLTSLRLNFCSCGGITDKGGMALAAKLPKSLTFLVIDFFGQKVGNPTCYAIGEALPASIENLDLTFSFTSVTDLDECTSLNRFTSLDQLHCWQKLPQIQASLP